MSLLVTSTTAAVHCLVCNRPVADPLWILGAAVCDRCEELLVATGADDPGYDRFVERFRHFWHGLAAAAGSSEARQ